MPKVLDKASSVTGYAGYLRKFPPLVALSVGLKANSMLAKSYNNPYYSKQDIWGDAFGLAVGFINPILGDITDYSIDNLEFSDKKANQNYNCHRSNRERSSESTNINESSIPQNQQQGTITNPQLQHFVKDILGWGTSAQEMWNTINNNNEDNKNTDKNKNSN